MNPEPVPAVAHSRPRTATDPGDVVGVIPVLLEFRPHRCVVVVGLVGTPYRIGPVQHHGLDAPPGEFAGPIIARLEGHGVGAVFVAVYAEPGREAAAAVEHVVTEYVRAVRAAGLQLIDAVHVHDDRWRSLVRSGATASGPVPDPATSPAPGVVGEVAALAVAEGRVILSSRDELTARVAGPAPGDDRAGVRLRRAKERVQDLAGELGVPGLHAYVVGLVEAAVGGAIPGGRAVPAPAAASRDPDDEALVVAALEVPCIRDDLATRTDLRLPALLDYLCGLARIAPDGDAVAVCCLVAWAALRDGNGALANAALERALAQEPDNPLARLLENVAMAMPPPHLVEQWTAAARARTAA